jgi:transposase
MRYTISRLRTADHDLVASIATNRLARSPGHPFYERLNRVLDEAGFDRFVEERCKPFYAAGYGRPSIPPGVYFRMLMVGYFEGIDSQRGIAWRCTDSLALREFLGVGLGDRVPDHSSLSVIRQRLPLDLHEEVFVFVLKVLAQKGVLRGKTIGVDATTLEANAAMKSIVRRDTGESWREYIRRLAAEEGVEDPSDDDARRMDRGRPKKRVSNEDWASPSDPQSRITKLKDGRTRLGYKAEHVVDLETEAVLAATIYPGDASDGETFVESLSRSQENVARADSEGFAEEVVTDKGYHKASTLAEVQDYGIRTYIPERNEPTKRRWRDKPREWREAFFSNRRRVRGPRDDAFSGFERNDSKEASLTSAPPEEHDAPGCAASRRCRSVTSSRSPRRISDCSCVYCSASGRRGASRGTPLWHLPSCISLRRPFDAFTASSIVSPTTVAPQCMRSRWIDFSSSPLPIRWLLQRAARKPCQDAEGDHQALARRWLACSWVRAQGTRYSAPRISRLSRVREIARPCTEDGLRCGCWSWNAVAVRRISRRKTGVVRAPRRVRG